MNWLSGNWIWLVLVGGMLWMHLGMHHGHGGHGGHSMSRPPRSGDVSLGQDKSAVDTESVDTESVDTESLDTGSSHRHRGW